LLPIRDMHAEEKAGFRFKALTSPPEITNPNPQGTLGSQRFTLSGCLGSTQDRQAGSLAPKGCKGREGHKNI